MKNSVFALLFALLTGPAMASVTILEKDQWKIDFGGFLETDFIQDSTRSLSEVPGNTPIAVPSSINNATGRTQFSIRNSRFAFNVMAPDMDNWKTRGYLEMDFLGYDPTAPANQSEANFFNNPTLRMRHGYLSAENSGWQILTGQTWALFGWQPYYFVPTVQVAPLSGQLYSRTVQMRVTKTFGEASGPQLQAALGVMRPPQRDSERPGIEAGARLALNERKGAVTGGSSAADVPQAMSLGISGVYHDIAIPSSPTLATAALNRFAGYAAAGDILIPILSSEDGKDVSNNLVLGGEFTFGNGYGDQFNGWTGGLPNPLSSDGGKTGTTPQYIGDNNTNLDAGIGGYDTNGNFHLIHLRTFDVYLQYHFPAWMSTWISGGYDQLYSSNIASLAAGTAATSGFNNATPLYSRAETYYGNIMHNFTKQVRAGFEYAQFRTTYVDGEASHDIRYQLSTWFFF